MGLSYFPPAIFISYRYLFSRKLFVHYFSNIILVENRESYTTIVNLLLYVFQYKECLDYGKRTEAIGFCFRESLSNIG